MEQPSEVYCLRLEGAGASIWPRNDDRCAECTARVIYDPGFQPPFPVVRLVCTVRAITNRAGQAVQLADVVVHAARCR